jgi:hypothetical protein
MGRYYSGDIYGKFWVGVQSSDDGEFFGAEAQEPSTVAYYAHDIEAAEEGLRVCDKELGAHKLALDDFFASCTAYNDATLAKALGVSQPQAARLLMWYARRELGVKIRDRIRDKDGCWFDADL